MILETFEEALSNLDEEGVAQHGDSWIDLVRDRLLALEGAYKILTDGDREPIDYSDLPTQAAYVFAYGMPRAGFTYERLKAHRALYGKPLFTSAKIRVSSLGGGPASELIGLLQYLEDVEMGETVKSVDYTVYDKDDEWASVAELVVSSAASDIDVNIRCEQLDLLNKTAVSKIDLNNEDLVLLSYVISEICAFDGEYPVEDNVRALLKTVKSGGLVFYLDSESFSFYGFFNECKKYVKGLRQQSDIGSNCLFDPGEYDGTFAEFCSELDRDPRLECNVVSKLLLRD